MKGGKYIVDDVFPIFYNYEKLVYENIKNKLELRIEAYNKQDNDENV